MAELNEHVAYLSQEIGPRPAGTEEEQRAALYVSEKLSAEAGLTTSMEDFQCNPDSSLPRALCCGLAVLVILLATIVSALAIPAIAISLICAALVIAEAFDKPILSRLLNRGVSQNVVAKYLPAKAANRASRRRKVIVVANYDTGKVRRDLKDPLIAVLPVVYWAELVALVLMPLVMIVRTLLSPDGTALIAFNVLLAVAMVVALLPVVSFVFEKLANYNEGANCNAAGVAVLLEVASRVAAARDLPDAPEPVIHGAVAAEEADLIPEGAEISYRTGNTAEDLGTSMESAAERLAAAKAAVAALSGKPVSHTAMEEAQGHEQGPAEVEEENESSEASGGISPIQDQAAVIAVSPSAAVHEVPDWFRKGQEQAKKPAKEKPVQRSRYATALEKAEEEISAREEIERRNADELSERMRNMRASVQAASVAAGATPTAVIADVLPEVQPEEEKPVGEESPADTEGAAAPSIELPDLPEIDVPSVSAESIPSPVDIVAPTPNFDDVPVVTGRSSSDIPTVIPAVVPAATPSHEVSSRGGSPVFEEDPDVIVRDGQRPLTGATVAAAPVSLADLEAVPSPSVTAESVSSRRVAVPSVGEVTAEATNEVPAAPAPRRRRAISLPNIGISQELPRISMDDRQQAAPLSEERPERDGRVHDLSAVIPSVSKSAQAPSSASVASSSAAEEALFDALPSLAGTSASSPALSGSINLAGTFSSMGATGAAEPIGEELLENASEENLYIEDVDDSAYVEQVTETGAMAGPGYVEMPKSRFGGLFGKLRRKKRDEQTTPQEWLEVEDSFDAREAGAARGSWESFREEEESFNYDEGYEAADETTAFTPDFGDDFTDDDFPAPRSRGRRGRHFDGGAFTRSRSEGDLFVEGEDAGESEQAVSSAPASVFSEGLPADFVFDPTPEVEQIEQFHNDRIDIEVWFVALGSELAGNGGMKAFMQAHEAEMKGSIVVELEALGDGELTLIDKEGTFFPRKASSRMKRLVRKAGMATGLKVPDATMEWRNSASAYALKHGQQAMHLAGMTGRKPAFFAEEDDVIENIDNDMLALNTDFVLELLKHI